MAFVALLEIELHLPDCASLKGKRKELNSIKAHLRGRYGAAVAETDHHDLWQRSTLCAALVARDQRDLAGGCDAVERYVLARMPDGASVRRTIRSADEMRGG